MVGGRLAYPDVDRAQIIQIHNQSLQVGMSIYAYGFFFALDDAFRKSHPPSSNNANKIGKFVENLRTDLLAAGLPRTFITWYPTPSRLRVPGHTLEQGWLVVLGTGFDKKLHAPIPDGLEERVKAILGTQDEPQWWLMEGYAYPLPNCKYSCIDRDNPN